MDLLEIIDNKQKSEPQIKLLIDGLLRSPWQCPDKIIDKYVTKSLAKILKKYKRSVLYFVFSNKKFCLFSSYITKIDIFLYEIEPFKKVDFSLQYELYKEVIIEDLEKQGLDYNQLSVEGQQTLIGLYLYATIAIYDVVGITNNHPSILKKIPYLLVKPRYLDAYLIQQFRRYCNIHSNITDYLYFYKIIKDIELQKLKKNSDFLKSVTNYLVDKTISINIRYLEKPFSLALQQLYERAQLLTYLICLLINSYLQKDKIYSQSILINNSELLKAGFTQDEIDCLIADIGKRTGFYNTILEKTESKHLLKLKRFSIKYCFHVHTKSLLDKFLKTKDKWFEKSYLIPYLKNELNSKRFIVGRGFQRNNKYANEFSNYDIDVVIYDKKTDLFYFCQVKHRLTSLMTNFRNELNTFGSEKIQDGIAQLTGIKQIINQDLIKQQIITAFQNTSLTTSYIRKNDFSQNSRFLFIHNMEDFDFCASQGITMYEWNTFRNLLKGYMVSSRIQNNNIESLEQHKELIVDFADLNAVKAISPANNTGDSEFKISKEYLQITIYSYSQLIILNKKICSFKKLECLAPYFN